jgi:hypothetical protein
MVRSGCNNLALLGGGLLTAAEYFLVRIRGSISAHAAAPQRDDIPQGDNVRAG